MTFDLNGVKIPKQRKRAVTANPATSPLIVCPFTVVVSSNEVGHAMDYTFTGIQDGDSILAIPTVARHLMTGDYAIDGMEDLCCVERKQLGDIYNCCGGDRKRFHAEVERMVDMEFSVVAIEANWREIANPAEYRTGWESRVRPSSVVGTIQAWSIRYPNIHWWACGDRRGAELRTFGILQAFWNEQQKK